MRHSQGTAQAGSADGYIRLWQIAADYKSITCRQKIPVVGDWVL
jgi:hypothetical protein